MSGMDVDSLYLHAFINSDSLAMLCSETGHIIALTQLLKQQLGPASEYLIGEQLLISFADQPPSAEWTQKLAPSQLENQWFGQLTVNSDFNFQNYNTVNAKALRDKNRLFGFYLRLGQLDNYPATLPRKAWLQLFEESTDGVVLINESMRIMSTNKAFRKLVDLKVTIPEAIPIENHIKVPGGFSKWLINSQQLSVNGTLSSQGQERSVLISVTPFEMGHKLLFWCFVHDLTQLQSNMKPPELDFVTRLFHDNHDGITLTSPSGEYLEANQRFAEILGVSIAEIIGKHYTYFNATLSNELNEEESPAFATKGYVEPFEKTLRTQNEDYVRVEIQRIPHYAANGKFIGDWSIIHAVTNKHPARNRLKYRFDTLFEQALDAIAYAQINGTITLANSAFCKLVGRSKDDLIGRDYAEFTYSDDVSREQHYYKEQLLGRGYTDVYDKKFVLPNGELVPVSIRSVLIRKPDGEPEGVWSISRDNKLRDRLIESLAESEHRFRSLFSSSFDAIGLWSTDDKLQYANKAYLDLIGYSQEELRGLTHHELTPIGNEEVDELLAQQLAQRGYSDVMEKVLRHKSGRLIPVSIRASGMMDGQGKLLGSWVILRDISDFQNALKRLEHSQNLLRQTSRMSRVGGWEFNIESSLFQLTDESYRILSLPTAYQMSSKSMAKLFDRNSESKVFRAINKALKTETHQEVELKLSGFEPERWVRVSAQVGYESDGKKYLYGAIQDITDFKVKEKTLEDVKNNYQHLAFHDPLTKLPNRLLLDDRFVQSTSQARRENSVVALLIIDLDDFKAINDKHGHPAGDSLLKVLAQRLSSSVRAHDTVARLGGDEFVIIARIDNNEQIPVLAGKIAEQISQPIRWKNSLLKTSCSIGVATYPDQGDSFDRLYKAADKALYRRKNNGKDGFNIA